jgi:hypothetical protein
MAGGVTGSSAVDAGILPGLENPCCILRACQEPLDHPTQCKHLSELMDTGGGRLVPG